MALPNSPSESPSLNPPEESKLLSEERSKHKRRSKTDITGRDYSCGCGKTYLSYPALYTHIKTKHAGATPTGTTGPICTTGRSRGRPRKTENVLVEEETPPGEATAPKFSPPPPKLRNNISIASIVKSERQRKAQQTTYTGEEVLKRLGVITEDRADPIARFQEFLRQVKTENVGKYSKLLQELEAVPSRGKGLNEGGTNCDKVLAEYLWEMGEKVTEKFFMVVLIFVRLYRDCLNACGWEIAKRDKNATLEEKNKNFTEQENTAEMIPDVCNEFVRQYLPREYPNFDKYLAVELTRHLCNWVHIHKYTHRMISLL